MSPKVIECDDQNNLRQSAVTRHVPFIAFGSLYELWLVVDFT